jgi:hypothetical protein
MEQAMDATVEGTEADRSLPEGGSWKRADPATGASLGGGPWTCC